MSKWIMWILVVVIAIVAIYGAYGSYRLRKVKVDDSKKVITHADAN